MKTNFFVMVSCLAIATILFALSYAFEGYRTQVNILYGALAITLLGAAFLIINLVRINRMR